MVGEGPTFGCMPPGPHISCGALSGSTELLTKGLYKGSFTGCLEVVTWELGFEGCLGVQYLQKDSCGLMGRVCSGPCRVRDCTVPPPVAS